MKNLLNFFISFDKLMKEKLVKAFYWLALILLAMWFASQVLDAIWLDPIAHIINFFAFFVTSLAAIVGLRLAAELAIAIFRINDNLSPDGGKSETADIDPIAEARRAAEEGVKRAREVSSNVVDRTRSSASDTKEKVEDAVGDTVESVGDDIEEAVAKVRKTVSKKSTTTTKKKPATKRASTKAKDGVRLKKDGTPAKKPGPKPKS